MVLTQGVLSEECVRVVVHRPAKGVQGSGEGVAAVRCQGWMVKGGVDWSRLVDWSPVWGSYGGEGGIRGRQGRSEGDWGDVRSPVATQDVVDVEGCWMHRLHRGGRVQRQVHTHGGGAGVLVLHDGRWPLLNGREGGREVAFLSTLVASRNCWSGRDIPTINFLELIKTPASQ